MNKPYKFLAFCTLASTYASIIAVFITAYLDPKMETVITINTGGEAFPELVLLLVTLPGILMCFRYLLTGKS